MANPVDLSVLISQLPRVQKMQEDAQRLPQVLQDQLAREVIEKQRREQHEVQKVEKSETPASVTKDKQGSEQNPEEQGSSGGQQEEESEQESSGDAGKLINLQV